MLLCLCFPLDIFLYWEFSKHNGNSGQCYLSCHHRTFKLTQIWKEMDVHWDSHEKKKSNSLFTVKDRGKAKL